MNFAQRISLLLHLVGFILGIFAIPIIFLAFIEGQDNAFFNSLLIVLIAPTLGWGLRWLISGELVHFIPFRKLVINSLPTQGNYFIALIIITWLFGGFIFNDTYIAAKESWEIYVFGDLCQNQDGSPNAIGYYTQSEEEKKLKAKRKAYYCSDFLIEDSRGETVCTWNNASNSETQQCKRLKSDPEPRKDYWVDTLLLTLFIFPIIFYLLTIIRLIINHREKKY